MVTLKILCWNTFITPFPEIQFVPSGVSRPPQRCLLQATIQWPENFISLTMKTLCIQITRLAMLTLSVLCTRYVARKCWCFPSVFKCWLRLLMGGDLSRHLVAVEVNYSLHCQCRNGSLAQKCCDWSFEVLTTVKMWIAVLGLWYLIVLWVVTDASDELMFSFFQDRRWRRYVPLKRR